MSRRHTRSVASAPMVIPEELRYSKEHEWVRLDGDVATVGITDFAQDSLGDVVFVQLPDIGTETRAGGVVSEIESTKSVSDIYAPMSGSVAAVNAALAERPELVNEDPYGEGWIMTIQCSDPGEVDLLLDAPAYRALIEG
jgi:glycine cleavage system H protein